jgi:radical SAM superfamily enzyme YgiQ (UPF0313 family)
LVIEEVAALAQDGVDTMGFWDDSFTVDRAWVLELCSRLDGLPGRPGWICMSRVEAVDPALLAAMARAGCYQVQFGVESASEPLMASLGKPTRLAQVRQAFATARAAGLETAGFFMLGMPGEDAAQRRATVNLAIELDPDYASFNLLTLLPGTPLYQARVPHEREWSLLDGRHAKEADRTLESDLALAYLRFYARPRYVARHLRRLRSAERALILGRAATDLLTRNLGKLAGH